MRLRLFAVVFLAFLVTCASADPVRAGDDYSIDPVHSSVYFKISHIGLSYVFGRFNTFSGTFSIDSNDASKCAFAMNIRTETVDTNNAGRDNHLRSPDFFNVKQYPSIDFKSTSVKPAKDGYEVTGDLTMHGVTKPVTFTVTGGKSAEFPKGVKRIGYSTELVLKRTDFGVGDPKLGNTLGEDVHIAISFEGMMRK